MMKCKECGGEICPPAVAGVERGSCHCFRGPGSLVGRLFYGTASQPASREYAVSWDGREVAVDPPTLSNALNVLNQFRTEWRRGQNLHALEIQ